MSANKADYEKLSIKELLAICDVHSINTGGYESKAQIIQILLEHDNTTQGMKEYERVAVLRTPYYAGGGETDTPASPRRKRTSIWVNDHNEGMNSYRTTCAICVILTPAHHPKQ